MAESIMDRARTSGPAAILKIYPMKIIYFDSVGGASGDMILACLADLGADLGKIERTLKRTVKDHFSIKVEKIKQNGLKGARVKVDISHHGAHGHEHHHRNLEDIEKIIKHGKFSPAVKENAVSVFRRLAQAEAKVHGVKPGNIHFHEVGALDSIVDIIGSCLALEQLGIEKVAVSHLPLGCGVIKCNHGILPSPAPATVELLKGFEVEQTGEKFELVTPTGAALLTAWKNMDAIPAGSKPMGAGYGFGHFELAGRPNLLRAILFECEHLSDKTEQCLVLECNIDDATPEIIGHLSSSLLTMGALDAFVTQVQMKKSRPGFLVTVICPFEKREVMLDCLFRESTTFGVREHAVQRTVLPRRFETVKTPYGKVRVKIGSWQGKDVTFAPEYEDCGKLAEKTGISARKIYESALTTGRSRGGRHS